MTVLLMRRLRILGANRATIERIDDAEMYLSTLRKSYLQEVGLIDLGAP